MFEGLVAWVLERYLGAYVENLDKSKLKISLYQPCSHLGQAPVTFQMQAMESHTSQLDAVYFIRGEDYDAMDHWSIATEQQGNVVLTDLVLRASALDELQLPVAVKWGKLGSLQLTVSWKHLLTKPISVKVDEVYLLAVPGTDVPYDRVEEERLAQEVKMAAVESMLAAQDAAATAEAESAAGTVFRVVNNVQVEISRIHVRFEDTGRTSGAKPFSCGLTLGEVSARSATESGALVDLRAWPAGLDDAIARKQLMLRGLSVFWTPSDHGFLTPVLARGTDRIHAAMQSVTPTDSSRIEHTQYVVHPISASGQFTINKKTQPQHELELEFDGIAVSLSADQYRSVLGAADYFAWLTQRERYKSLRPRRPLHRNAKEWWKFALRATVHDHHLQTKPWTWKALRARRDARIKYKKLFQESLTTKGASAATEQALAAIERTLTAEDIVLYRRMVLAMKRNRDARAATSQKLQQSSWFSWRTSQVTPSDGEPTDDVENEADLAANAAAFRELMKGERMSALGGDPTTVGLTTAVVLKRTSVELTEQSRSGTDAVDTILRVTLDESGFFLKQRPVAQAVSITGYLGAYNATAVRQDGQLSTLVTPMWARRAAKTAPLDLNDQTKSVEILFETKPIMPLGAEPIDIRARIAMHPAEIFVSAPAVNRIAAFFGETHTEVIDFAAISDAATLAAERQSIRGLERLVKDRALVDLHVHIAAPLLVIPASDDDDAQTMCVLIDLGTFEVSTVLQETNQPNLIGLSDADLALRVGYDIFDVTLSGMQVLLCPQSSRQDYRVLELPSSPQHLLNKVDMSFIIKKRVVEYHTELPGLVVDGELQKFQLVVSTLQIKQLADIYTAISTQLGDEPTERTQSSKKAKSLTVQNDAHEPVVVGLSADEIERKLRRRELQARNKVMQIHFVIHEMGITLGYYSASRGEAHPVLGVAMHGVQIIVSSRQWDQHALLNLSSAIVTSHVAEHPLDLIVAMSDGDDRVAAATNTPELHAFFTADLRMCDPKSPLFAHEDFGRSATRLKVAAKRLNLLADQQSLCQLLVTTDDMLNQLRGTVVELGAGVRAGKTASNHSAGVTTAAAREPPAAVGEVAGRSSEPRHTAVHAEFDFDVVCVTLREGNRDFVALSMEGLSTTFRQESSGNLEVTAKLSALSLRETVVDPEIQHSTIATLGGDSVFDLVFVQSAVPCPMDGSTGSLTLRVGQLQFVYLQPYIDTLSDFLRPIVLASNPVSQHAATLAAAVTFAKQSTATGLTHASPDDTQHRVDTTVVAIQEALQGGSSRSPQMVDTTIAPKYRLDVMAEAPLIILPLNPMSTDVIAFNLGVIKMVNKFETAPTGITDHIGITISSLRAARSVYDFRTGCTTKEQPAFFSLPAVSATVNRAVELTVPRVSGPVNFAVAVDAGTVQMALTTETIQFVFDVLDQNINVDTLGAPLSSTIMTHNLRGLSSPSESGGMDERAPSTTPSEALSEATRDGLAESDDGWLSASEFHRAQPGVADESNGVSVAVKVTSATVHLINPMEQPLAELSLVGINLTYAHDPRGMQTPTTSGSTSDNQLCDTALAFAVQDFVVVDQRSGDPSLFTPIIQSCRASASSSPLATVSMLQTQGALQVFRARSHRSDQLPMCHEALLELFAGVTEPTHLYKDLLECRSTVLFEHGKDRGQCLAEAMAHCRAVLPRMPSLYSHADWDPDASDTTIRGNFKQLEIVASTDFLINLIAFSDVRVGHSNVASVDSQEPAAHSLPKDAKLFLWGTLSPDPVPYPHSPLYLIELELEDQRVVVVEDTTVHDRASAHCIHAVVSAQAKSIRKGATQLHTIQLRGQLLSGSRVNPEVLIVPKLEVHMQLQSPIGEATENGDTETVVAFDLGAQIHVKHVDAHVSLSDINLLQRVFAALGSAHDHNTRSWRPSATTIPRTMPPRSSIGSVKSEFAEIHVQSVTLTLVDDLQASAPPILRASLALADCVVTNWSSNLAFRGDISLAISNYNAMLMAWEPLLVGGAPSGSNLLVPFTAKMLRTVPQTEWVPPNPSGGSSAQNTLRVIYGNQSSKCAVSNMLDGNTHTFWDGGTKGHNYCVFDFGRTVLCLRMRFCSQGSSQYAPKRCELFVGVEPDPKSAGWKRVHSFVGSCPADGATALIQSETDAIRIRTRYLKWVIKDRHGRGPARIVSASFETRGEGVISSVTCPRPLELTMSDKFLSEIQGHQASVLSRVPKTVYRACATTHEVLNLTDIAIGIESPVTKQKVLIPAGGTTAIFLPARDAALAGERAGDDSLRPIHPQYTSMTALVALGQSNMATSTLAHLTIGDWGSIYNVPVGTCPSLQMTTCTGVRGSVRVAVSVVEGHAGKRILISAPTVVQNSLAYPIHMACLTSTEPPSAPDVEVPVGFEASFPLGLMENVETDMLAPLYSLRSCRTLRHFYTIDVLDIRYLCGTDWQEEGILGYISIESGQDLVPLWASIPCADRPVSTLRTSNQTPASTRGLRLLGYVPATASAQSRALAVQVTDSGDQVWTVQPPHVREGAVIVWDSPPRILVRPTADYQWGTEIYYPAMSTGGRSVRIVSCASRNAARAPATFALVRSESLSTWVACTLVTVSNSIPYPLHVGLSAQQADDPVRGTVIAAHSTASVPVPHETSRGGLQMWLKVRLTERSPWSAGIRVRLDPSLSRALESCDLRLAFEQGQVKYNILLKANESTVLANRSHIESVHHFVVFCPYIVQNSTGRPDLDCVGSNAATNAADLATSLWRPLGATFGEPALFSPFDERVEAVRFLATGQTSSVVQLFTIADSGHRVHLTPSSSRVHSAIESWLQRKLRAQEYSALVDKSSESVIIITNRWNDGSMLFREITIRPTYEVRNRTTRPFRVVQYVHTEAGSKCLTRSAVVPVGEVLQLNLPYQDNAYLKLELDNSCQSTPFSPTARKDGNAIVTFALPSGTPSSTGEDGACARSDAGDSFFESFDLAMVERLAIQSDSTTAVLERSRSFAICVRNSGKRAPYRFENICDTVTCEFWQVLPDGRTREDRRVQSLFPFQGAGWAPEDSAVVDLCIAVRLTDPLGHHHEAVVDLAAECSVVTLSNSSVYVVSTPESALFRQRILFAPSIDQARQYAGLSPHIPTEVLESSTSVHVNAIGLSIIGTAGFTRELVYLRATSLDLTAEVTTHFEKRFGVLKNLQIDNSNRSTVAPALLRHRGQRDARGETHPIVRMTQIAKRGHVGGQQTLGAVRFVHQQSGRYLHSHEKQLRGPFFEVVVVDHRDRNNIFTMSDVDLSSVRGGEGNDTVHYGDTVRLKHRETKHYLHSHAENRQRGNQFEVVAYDRIPDENDSWIVCPPAKSTDAQAHASGKTIRNGAVIRLKHKESARFLRMANFFGPKTRNHPAASCYSTQWDDHTVSGGDSEESSEVDNWIIEVDDASGGRSSRSGHSIEYTSVSLQSFDVSIDGDVIPALTSFLAIAQPDTYTSELGLQASAEEVALIMVEQPVFYKELIVHPIQVSFTFQNTASSDFLAAFPVTLNDFAVHLSSCELHEQTFKFGELSNRLGNIYTKKVMSYMMTEGVWRGVGSLAILGNPESALTKMGGGLKQLLYDPAMAVVHGPEEFGDAVGRGVVGFASSTISALTGSASTLTEAVGAGASKLTFDKEFQKQRTADMRNKDVKTGVRRFFGGVTAGVVGVFADPIKGARDGGAAGAVKGVGTGVAGLLFKPLIGVVDLVSGTVAQVGAVADGGVTETSRLRVRDVRHIGPRGVVSPFSDTEAWGASFVAGNFAEWIYVSHEVEAEPVWAPAGHQEFKIFFICLNALYVVLTQEPNEPGHPNTTLHQSVHLTMVTHILCVPSEGLIVRFEDTSETVIVCSELCGRHLMRRLEDLLSSTGAVEEATSQFIAVRQRSGMAYPSSAVATEVQGSATRQVRLTERMRYYPLKGWTRALLPTDPPPLENEQDGTTYQHRDDVSPPQGWAWVSPWMHEAGGDGDHWYYAVDWGTRFCSSMSFAHFVRRRYLIRTVKNVSDNGGRGKGGSAPRLQRHMYVRPASEDTPGLEID